MLSAIDAALLAVSNVKFWRSLDGRVIPVAADEDLGDGGTMETLEQYLDGVTHDDDAAAGLNSNRRAKGKNTAIGAPRSAPAAAPRRT